MSYIDFEWARAFAKDGGPAYEYSRGKIRQIGRGIDDGRRPLEIDQSLWSRFAKLDGRSPSACVEFAHAWGLLTIPAVIGSAVGAEEPLDLWRSEIERVGFWLRGLSAARVPFGKAKTWVTEIKVGVEMTPVENRLVLSPANLIDAMLLQLVQVVTAGASIQTCEQCGEWFAAGGSARRSIAKFCSERCKNRSHYERRAGK